MSERARHGKSVPWLGPGAWTFQEHVLSMRTIVCFEDATAWRCHYAMGRRHRSGMAGLSIRLAKTSGLYRGIAVELRGRGRCDSKRSLSHERDICNAFAGICGAVAEEVLWGLPCIAFERYPTWGPGAAGRHRAADASSYLGSPAGPGSRGAGTYVWGVAASMRRGLQNLCYRWDSDIQDLTPISSAPAEPLPSATEQGEIPTSHQYKKKDTPPALSSTTHTSFSGPPSHSS
jgi:hypothetical protein